MLARMSFMPFGSSWNDTLVYVPNNKIIVQAKYLSNKFDI